MKLRSPSVILVAVTSAALVACVAAVNIAPASVDRPGLRGADATALAQIATTATSRARETAPDAALRQIDLDTKTAQLIFRFTDARPSREITVAGAGTVESPPIQWRVASTTVSPLVSAPRPALKLEALQVGPASAARALRDARSDARERTLTLVQEGADPSWIVFGDVAEGTISGRLTASGSFQMLGPGAARQPSVAPRPQ
jgi:hypothetical protein